MNNLEKNNFLPSVIICDCSSPEHQILIYKDKDFSDNYREVSMEIHLVTHRNFFKRLWVGLKYAFGYKCRYGHWDSIVISTKNYHSLKDAIEFLEEDN